MDNITTIIITITTVLTEALQINLGQPVPSSFPASLVLEKTTFRTIQISICWMSFVPSNPLKNGDVNTT